jgi:transcriptional regulator with GAF, ATPase, and Fis domain
MGEKLTASPTVGSDAMWTATRDLIDRVSSVLDKETALDDCLDLIASSLGADRGLILLVHEDGTTQPIHARSMKKPLDPFEYEEISKTIVARALATPSAAAWDLSSSVRSLGDDIRAALAAPLGSSEKTRAVLYLDFRDPRKFVERPHIEFFMSASQLVGALLDQHWRGERVRARLDEALSHCTDTRRTPPLEDLLAATSFAEVRREVLSAIKSPLSMLIMGESGSGKTLLAQAIAEASGRRPIVRAMLGGSDDLNTITSELFGHERGSFTGAASRRVGLVEYADKGTLIFDELLNLPVHAQKLLLDFTQFGTYRPLGHSGVEPKRADVRIISATNGDLHAAIRDGRFREDLYQRLASVVVTLPPLRDRRSDIPRLAESTLKRVDPSRSWNLSLEMRRLLVSPALEWTGNVRQLERVITRVRDRALVRDPEATELRPEHLESRDLDGISPLQAKDARAPVEVSPSSEWQQLHAERARLDDRERAVIQRSLIQAGGVVAQAARGLGIARTTLASRIEILGMKSRSKDPPPSR